MKAIFCRKKGTHTINDSVTCQIIHLQIYISKKRNANQNMFTPSKNYRDNPFANPEYLPHTSFNPPSKMTMNSPKKYHSIITHTHTHPTNKNGKKTHKQYANKKHKESCIVSMLYNHTQNGWLNHMRNRIHTHAHTHTILHSMY
uniref:Uncharacterized protein n=1 Tax=Ditylum brightwellii TaxID=49249 RepID=A0A7S2E976_9STRA|mmetsp:Transcript_19784/g.29488  ORF Transcript_19784/g.29488 Transcript_19784/m.29488 type:complete len:144 (+) Transcript_19784:205-636(+)